MRLQDIGTLITVILLQILAVNWCTAIRSCGAHTLSCRNSTSTSGASYGPQGGPRDRHPIDPMTGRPLDIEGLTIIDDPSTSTPHSENGAPIEEVA